MVSRRHAVVEYRGNQFFLRDCNSSNGSLVNGDRVSERGLRDGDLVAIGTARLLFREDAEAEEAGAKVVQHPSAPRLNCPSCQAPHRKEDLFCRQCGTRLAQAIQPKVVCTSCGTVVLLPAGFCNACGASLARGDEALEITKPRPVEDAAAPPPGLPEPSQPEPPPPPRADEVEPPRSAREPAERPKEPVPIVPKLRAPAPPPRPQAARPPRPSTADTSTRALDRAGSRSEPASLDRRLLAGLLDAGVVLLGQALLVAPAVLYWWDRELPRDPKLVLVPALVSVGLLALAAALGAVYFVYFWGVRGATPGKLLMGLAVEGIDGRCPIGIAQALNRFLGYLLSGALLGAGFLMIALGATALHDRIAATRVVRRERI